MEQKQVCFALKRIKNMKDRFKFRAWDNEKKQFISKLVVFSTGEPAEYDCGFIDIFPDDTVILEQCTGIRDKNRALIFEGDIVKRESLGLGDTFAEFDGAVEYTQGQYFSTNNYYEKSAPIFDEIATFEIIGNIHQNPELLENI